MTPAEAVAAAERRLDRVTLQLDGLVARSRALAAQVRRQHAETAAALERSQRLLGQYSQK